MIDTVILDGGHASRATHLPTHAKCLATMPDGRPLLDHLLGYLARQRIRRVVVALSEGREAVLDHLTLEHRQLYAPMIVTTDVNPRRSGTVDAVRHVRTARLPPVFKGFGLVELLVLNGDTLLDADLGHFVRIHRIFAEPATVLHGRDMEDGAFRASSARILGRALGSLDQYAGQNLDRDYLHGRAYNYYDPVARFLDLGTPAGWEARSRW